MGLLRRGHAGLHEAPRRGPHVALEASAGSMATGDRWPFAAEYAPKGHELMALMAQIFMVVVTIAAVVGAVLVLTLMGRARQSIESAYRACARLPELPDEELQSRLGAEEPNDDGFRLERNDEESQTRLDTLALQMGALATTPPAVLDRLASRVAGVLRGIQAALADAIRTYASDSESGARAQQGDDPYGDERWMDDGGTPAGSRRGSRAGAAVRDDGR
jgi:hypothetical protein